MIHHIRIEIPRTTLHERINCINIISDNGWEGLFNWDHIIISNSDEKISNDFNATKETWIALIDKHPELNEFINDYRIITDEQ